MEWTCAHTRPCFILSSERVLGTWVRTHVNSKWKIPSTGGSKMGRTCNAASRRTANPTHYQLSYSSPTPHKLNIMTNLILSRLGIAQFDFGNGYVCCVQHLDIMTNIILSNLGITQFGYWNGYVCCVQHLNIMTNIILSRLGITQFGYWNGYVCCVQHLSFVTNIILSRLGILQFEFWNGYCCPVSVLMLSV